MKRAIHRAAIVAGSMLLALLPPPAISLARASGAALAQRPPSTDKTAARATEQQPDTNAPRTARQTPGRGQRPATCVVPDLTGRDTAAARTELGRFRLSLGSVGNRISDRARGSVVAQQPQPRAEVPCGSSVDVWLAVSGATSDGPPPARTCVVPDVVGKQEDESRKELAKAKLEVGRIATRQSDKAAGSVIGQSLEAGSKVPCAARVDLIVAAAPKEDGETSTARPALHRARPHRPTG